MQRPVFNEGCTCDTARSDKLCSELSVISACCAPVRFVSKKVRRYLHGPCRRRVVFRCGGGMMVSFLALWTHTATEVVCCGDASVHLAAVHQLSCLLDCKGRNRRNHTASRSGRRPSHEVIIKGPIVFMCVCGEMDHNMGHRRTRILLQTAFNSIHVRQTYK